MLHIGIEQPEHDMERGSFFFARSVVMPWMFAETRGMVKSARVNENG